MTQSAADIEREVEKARGDLDRTVEALKDKMTPGQLIDELSKSLKGGGTGEMMNNLGAQVRDNPMALAMIGAGMAWLMMGKTEGASPAPSPSLAPAGPSQPLSSPIAAAAEVAHATKDKVGEAAAGLKEKVAGAASSLQEGVAGAAHDASQNLHAVGDQAAAAARKTGQSIEGMLQHEPLIIGAFGLAVGVALGAAFPATPLENKTFGAARDKLLEAGEEKLAQAAQHARAAGEAAVEAAKTEADQQHLQSGGTTLVDKVETVAQSAIDAARSELGQGRPPN